MKYVYECYFNDKPECKTCMLSKGDGGEYKYCMALGMRPRCPEEGHHVDCPLKPVDPAQEKEE